MILRFRFKNYKCFRDEAELSFVAAPWYKDDWGTHPVPGTDERALTVLGLYGPNASGKSVVLDALAFFGRAVRDSYRAWPVDGPLPLRPFLLEEDSARAPTEMALDFVLEGTRLCYRFVLSPDRVVEEELLAWPEGHQRTLFHRQGQDFRFSRHLKGKNRSFADLTRSTALFLTMAAEHGHEVLLPIFRYVVDVRNPLSPEWLRNPIARNLTAQLHASLRSHDRPILDLLRAADLGVRGMEVYEQQVKPALDTQGYLDVLARTKTPDAEKVLDVLSQASRLEVELLHESTEHPEGMPLRWADESTGTQAWFALAGVVMVTLEQGTMLILDELQASLHPLLAAELLRLFNDPSRNPKGAQLLFNSHDVSLLGGIDDPQCTLRRDQVWFTQKAPSGASRLYPLTDFKPRKNENVAKAFLEGRYGAVPYTGDLTRWRIQQEDAHGEE